VKPSYIGAPWDTDGIKNQDGWADRKHIAFLNTDEPGNSSSQDDVAAEGGGSSCYIERHGPLDPPLGVRTRALVLPREATIARRYRGVTLPALCSSDPSQRRRRPRESFVFYSIFTCEQRLKLVNPGFAAGAKRLLERGRQRRQQEEHERRNMYNEHRRAVHENLKPYAQLNPRVLAHFRQHLLRFYQPSHVSAVVATVASYLGSRDVFRTPEGAPLVAASKPSDDSTHLMTQLKGCIAKVQLRSTPLEAGVDVAEMRALAASTERAMMKDAYVLQHTSSKEAARLDLTAEEDGVIDSLDERLVDLAALRGFANAHYRAGSASATIATKLAALQKAIEWRRSYHQGICNGIRSRGGEVLTVTGVTVNAFDKAMDVVAELLVQYRRRGAQMDTNRNVPRRPSRSVVPDISVYDDLACALEKDVLAFSDTARAWCENEMNVLPEAYDDLLAASVSFLQCGFVPSRPLPLASITLGQWEAAHRDASERHSALVAGQVEGGAAVTGDTILCTMRADEKHSARGNGQHQFIITPRVISILGVYELARRAVPASRGRTSPFFVKCTGEPVLPTQLSRLVNRTTAWYTGHPITITMLRSAHATALAGDDVSRFAEAVTQLEAVAAAPPSNEREMMPSKDSTLMTIEAKTQDQSATVQTNEFHRLIDDAKSRREESVFVKNATITSTQGDAAFALAGGDIGHGRGSHVRHYVDGAVGTRHHYQQARLARILGAVELKSTPQVRAFDINGIARSVEGQDEMRLKAILVATTKRKGLAARPVEEYYAAMK